MAIFVSDVLKQSAESCSVPIGQLVKMFEWWKADSARVNQCMWFGKDSDYNEPQLQGRGRLLRHCHLIPLLDQDEHDAWLRVYKMRGEKVSDKALVYAENEGDFILLYIFGEPGAHRRARRDMRLMNALYRRAIEFVDGDHRQCHAAA